MVRKTLQDLHGLPGTRLLRSSSLYLSAPVQASGPDYVNAVACLDTQLAAEDLWTHLQALEKLAGRQRPYARAPRTLDLDLLLYGDGQISNASLSVPHPRLHLRAFVILPLLEIDPTLEVPGLGKISLWRDRLDPAQVIRRLG